MMSCIAFVYVYPFATCSECAAMLDACECKLVKQVKVCLLFIRDKQMSCSSFEGQASRKVFSLIAVEFVHVDKAY